MEPTYELIKPIIIEETWTANQVSLKFKASNQEYPLQSVGIAMASEEEMKKKMNAEIAKMTASSMAVNTASSALGNLAGISGVGSLVGSAASQMGVGYQMDVNKMMQVELTDEVKKKTIVDAFKTMQTYYEFENGQWVYKMPKP